MSFDIMKVHSLIMERLEMKNGENSIYDILRKKEEEEEQRKMLNDMEDPVIYELEVNNSLIKCSKRVLESSNLLQDMLDLTDPRDNRQKQ